MSFLFQSFSLDGICCFRLGRFSLHFCTGLIMVNRFRTKKVKEEFYRRLFPAYTSIHRHRLYFINECTPLFELFYLRELAGVVRGFVIDTESDYPSQSPALIQILFLTSIDEESPLLLLESTFLPPADSLLFNHIRLLCADIFRSDAFLFAWGPLEMEIIRFTSFSLIVQPLLSFVIDVQSLFKIWFNRWILDFEVQSFMTNDHDQLDDVLIINAPTHDPLLFLPAAQINERKILSAETWSLQDAIAYTFHQYLSKRCTLDRWSVGLDPRLTRTYGHAFNNREDLIAYAATDCLSVAHLLFQMVESSFASAIIQFDHSIVTGQYISFDNTHVSSVLFQSDHQPFSSSIEDEITSVRGIGHELNDRPFGSVSDAEQSIDYASVHYVDTRPRRSRSSISKRKRNQKSSLRHRRHRYHYEVIRPVNTTITLAKQLLHQWHIHYININIVRSTLYIGVKTSALQHSYDALLPVDLFL